MTITTQSATQSQRLANIRQTIDLTLASPACSDWLRNSLSAGMKRDVCDAAADAAHLAYLLNEYCNALLNIDA